MPPIAPRRPPLHRAALTFSGGRVSLLVFILGAAAHAQDLANSSPGAADAIAERVIVTGRADSLIGLAGSAAEGSVGQQELSQRPVLRPGEVLETIPGVIITQHAGGGKANQFFLRGFNLDHGTDFATSVGGVPINLPSHAHGQGYTDLNFLIPELVDRVTYEKGPYYARNGDFSSAGAAELRYFDRLPNQLAILSGGNFGFARTLLAGSRSFGASGATRRAAGADDAGQAGTAPASGSDLNPGTLLGAIELYHNDGPWVNPEDYQKLNVLLRYSQGDGRNGFSLTANGYAGRWTGEQQIARRAYERGEVGYFGSLDESDGGSSHRAIFSGEWHAALTENSLTTALLYTSYYDLDMFSNFTYYLNDPARGDQFEQKDQRQVSGLKLEHQIFDHLFDREVTTAFGLQVRNDYIFGAGLNQTQRRQEDEVLIDDQVVETSVAPYVENRVQWTPWLRSVAGLRGDLYFFDVASDTRANRGHDDAALLSPKLQLVLGPFARTEFYLDGGFGFHSNDARGVTARVDPASGDAIQTAPGLVRSKGAEIGVRTTAVPQLQSTFSLWYLKTDGELVFSGDAGNTEPSRAGRRYGVEVANYYTPAPWLTLDLDFAASNARYTQPDPVGDHIPEAIETVLAAGISLHDFHGFDAGLRVRYFGPRALIEDDRLRTSASTLVYARVGYRLNATWSVDVDIFNLFDSKVNDQEYYYPSRLKNEPAGPDDGGYNDRHFHPAESRSVRATVTARF